MFLRQPRIHDGSKHERRDTGAILERDMESRPPLTTQEIDRLQVNLQGEI